MIEVLGLYKRCGNELLQKKWKHWIYLALCHWFSSIFHQMFGKMDFHQIFEKMGCYYIKNYGDDLDIIDRGHCKGNISQFCLYLGYPWTNFNQISTTMMASWLATQKVISSDLENVDQGHHLQKILYLSYLFYRNDGNMVGKRNIISADLWNVNQGHHWQKILAITQLM